jgi:hypothetical protein
MTPLLVQERLVQEQVLVQQQVQVPVLAQVVELVQELVQELELVPQQEQVLVLVLNPRLPLLQSQFLLQPCHLLVHESLSTHLQ